MKELKTTFKRSTSGARCPLRPKEYCLACQYGVTGPQDCPIVYLARADYDTRLEWAKRRLAEQATARV